MIKIGGRPGIPFRVTLTTAEERLHDTNKLWHEQSRRGELEPQPTRRADGAPERLTGCARQTGTRPAPRRSRRCSPARSRCWRSPPWSGEAAAQAGAALDHWRHRPPLDPLALVLELADGRTHWPPAATPILIGCRARACADRGRLHRGRARRGGRRAARIARRGCWVPAAASIRSRLRTRGRRRERFGVAQPGLPIAQRRRGRPDAVRDLGGHAVRHLGAPQRQVELAARSRRCWPRPAPRSRPRTSPTCTRPPAAVREQHGRVWNFDPEAIAAGEPDWWWNPLSYVTSDRRALELTDAFVGAYRDPDARPDPFFDPAGQELVSHLLCAPPRSPSGRSRRRFCGQRAPTTTSPRGSCRSTGWSWPRRRCSTTSTRRLSSAVACSAPPGRSSRSCATPTSPAGSPRSGPADRRAPAGPGRVRGVERHAVPAQQGGPGQFSAGLVTALAMALCDAAEQLAKRSPGGRLADPAGRGAG